MDLKLPRFDSGKLGGIKDRLGFSDDRDMRQDSYADDYDEYGDYGEYGYDESEEDQYREFDDTPSYASTSAARSGSYTMPALVTAEDVRANTRYTPPPTQEQPRTSRDTVQYQQRNALSPAQRKYDLENMQVDEQRSAGLQSLFTPTTGLGNTTPSYGDSAAGYSGSSSVGRSANSAADRMDVSESSSYTSRSSVSSERSTTKDPIITTRSARILTVIKPQNYSDAERVAKIVRTGDVAVLSLRETSEDLTKRILDFSFGVACALDAHVDYVSNLVFIITRGSSLSEDEEARLRGQGLM